jgi:catalase-peroxidase
VRETFARMAMNDEETAALTCGGHTVGKAHGNGDAGHARRRARRRRIEDQGFGWVNPNMGGKATNAVTSGIEGAWTTHPTKWDMGYFDLLFGYEWELTKSPAGANQWRPVDIKEEDMPVDPTDPSKRVMPMMTDADMAMKMDPIYNAICQKFMADPEYFADTFARAWFKLTHRDMGPRARYVGPDAPAEDLIWQDPIPAGSTLRRGARQGEDRGSGPVGRRHGRHRMGQRADLPRSDLRGGANGARIRLAPQKDWEGNEPSAWPRCWRCWSRCRGRARRVGCRRDRAGRAMSGVSRPSKAAGFDVEVPFTPGRGDATDEHDRCRQLLGAGAARRRVPQLAEEDYAVGARRADARPGAASGPDGRR